jgi:flagellar biosynthetic protein FlhB
MANDRTEKATPRQVEKARRKGQVARSADLNGAAVLLAAFGALAVFGPEIFGRLRGAMQAMLVQAGQPEVVGARGLGGLMTAAALTFAVALAPLALSCLVAGVGASVAQVGFKPATEALKPDVKRLNPVQGAKNIFGLNAVVETIKGTTKIVVVGGIAALALFPKLTDLAALVGIPPVELGSELVRRVSDICWKAGIAYLLIAAADFFWQRIRHERQLRMRKDDVKREQKEESVAPELRGALRRRASEMSRGRMMAAVLDADVVVANPTHFAVALVYDGTRAAPQVVAKGQDLIALQIRRVAEENGVAVVENPPLARSLHGAVEIGQEIPEQLFQAVAELLAFVYRTRGATRPATADLRAAA